MSPTYNDRKSFWPAILRNGWHVTNWTLGGHFGRIAGFCAIIILR
jgi:hypothetical protein